MSCIQIAGSQQKKAATLFCWLVLAAFSLNACATTGMHMGKGVAIGTAVGAAGGVAIGAVVGNTLEKNGLKNADWIGPVIGGILGATAGYLIAERLNADEQQDYENKTKANLNQQNSNQPTTSTWSNTEGTKTITTTSAEAKPVGATVSDLQQQNIKANIALNIPKDSVCRQSTRIMTVKGEKYEETSLHCRDSNGDYAPVDIERLASSNAPRQG